MELNFNDYSEQNFETIVKETKLLVLKTIGETLIDRFDESTEDVLQEVYFRVFKALKKGQFRGDSKLSTWIFTIARNEANRVNAKRLREEEKATEYLEGQLFTDGTSDNEKDILDESRMKSLLEKVPLFYRKPLALYLSGRTMEEIARDLIIKQGTVKSRLFRAKAWIRKNLGGELKHET